VLQVAEESLAALGYPARKT
jgi:hypothetical protein